jgi:3-deoxy-7-phosphoheptulonate synthase
MNASAFPLAAREEATSVAEIGGVAIGGSELVLIAGPCSVECEEQLREAALAARAAGATILRGGAFKPRTSPYSFQGLGEEGLALLRAIGDETGLPVVTEALEPGQVPLVAEYSDAIQIGSRNMHVTPLLRAAAASGRPILLKRGMSATLEELLLAAETILLAGNESVILCERGIRTFDSYTRNCLDVGGIAALKRLTHLPVVADPSHATGRRELVTDAALAAVAAGADGLIVEAHPHPQSARSDVEQQLTPEELADLAGRVERVAVAIGRGLSRASACSSASSARTSEETDPVISRLREEISENDRRIVDAINARLELVARMRSHKRSRGIAFRDRERELSLLRGLQRANPGPLSPEGLEEIFLELLELTKREVAGKAARPQDRRGAKATT